MANLLIERNVLLCSQFMRLLFYRGMSSSRKIECSKQMHFFLHIMLFEIDISQWMLHFTLIFVEWGLCKTPRKFIKIFPKFINSIMHSHLYIYKGISKLHNLLIYKDNFLFLILNESCKYHKIFLFRLLL